LRWQGQRDGPALRPSERYMNFADQLRILQAAQGDPAELALVTVDLAYPSLPESGRAPIKQALEAVATSHWCDETILSDLLDISPEESADRLARLRSLSVVETFPARGKDCVNVHEASRLALRKRMAANHSARFRELSARAARCFARNLAPVGRIEWIYHLMSADPDRAALECEALNREWTDIARPEDHHALAIALEELAISGLVTGPARVEVLLCMLDSRAMRGESTSLEPMARNAIRLAQAAGVVSGEAHATCVLGDSLLAQGKLGEAQAAFEEFLRIASRNLAREPGAARWQRRVVLAHGRIGDVWQMQDRLDEAKQSFEESLQMSRRLAAQDSSDLAWKRLLAVSHSQVGRVLQAQGKLAEAQEEFGESLAILRGLLALDPSNVGRQRDLAAAGTLAGDVLEAQSKFLEAQAEFEQYLAISQRLVEHDPSNTGSQRDLAAAHSRMGGVLQAQGKLVEAQAEFEKSLAITRRLAELDVSDAGWQHSLAVACVSLARLKFSAGNHIDALPLYGEASQILGNLTKITPGFPQWAEEKELVDSELALRRSQSSAG
jgi:tetratricopeptide (TPR) repeat protein